MDNIDSMPHVVEWNVAIRDSRLRFHIQPLSHANDGNWRNAKARAFHGWVPARVCRNYEDATRCLQALKEAWKLQERRAEVDRERT